MDQPKPSATHRHGSPRKDYTNDSWWRSRVVVGAVAVILHSFACVFYVGMAKLHLYVKNNPTAVIAISFTKVDLLRYFDVVIAAAIILAVLHGFAILGPWGWWIVMRRRHHDSRVHATDSLANTTSDRDPVRPSSRWQRIQHKIDQWDHNLEQKIGADMYELLVFVELGLQTFQAYKMSHLIATRWINRLVVLAIVANCWFMPIVSFVFRKKPSSYVKSVLLALDATIEVVYGMAIPLAVLWPYYRDAMDIFYGNPFLGWYTDTWFVNAIAENRQLWVSSWIDFVSKMAPGFSLVLRLQAFQFQRAEFETRTRTASHATTAPSHSVLRKKRLVAGLMGLWGIGVLAAHLAATAVSLAGTDRGCLLDIVPFGSTQYSCVVLEVSCSQKRITGTKSELDDALSHVDPLTVQFLVFSHCEALAMPPRLKTFPNLVEIKVHNCSIAEWGDDAALTAQHHLAFQFLFVTLTNMSQIPDGILSADPPPAFADFQLVGTNLTGIPDDMFDKVPTILYFFLERSPHITKFPQAFRSPTSPQFISLVSNSITTLPDDVFVDRALSGFVMTGNPITSLPAELGSAPGIPLLSFASTQLSSVPQAWVDASAAFTKTGNFILAKNTPLCARLEQIRSQNSGGSARDDAERLSWIQCDRSVDPSYPLDFELQLRKRNRD